MLLIAAIFAIVPMIILGILTAVAGSMSPLLGLGFLSFPILPFAYLFAAYRRQAGGLEVRGNRVFTIYAFLILLGTLMVSLLVAGSRLPIVIPDQFLILGMIATAIATALSLWVFPLFQNFVERRFLGIAIASRQLQQAYSSHITGSTSFARLTGLLRDEIMPSLLVRQFVFLIQDGSATRVLLNIGVERDHIPTRNTGDLLERLAGNTWTVASPRDDRLSWIRLALPLKLEQDLLGLWLFGRRDPDDTYSSIEVPILRSFADQAAVALSNILQTERLRALYRANINRHENERLSLARELHDSVLNELAGMLMNADMASLPRSFQDGYQALTQRLREIVSDLRPPMLSYGLKPAIEELADNLMERSKIAVSITVDFQSTGERYPPDKEQHLFRIVQEACENALRHSHGQKVKVSGSLESNHVELQIEDNGDGFELGRKPLEIQDLVSERHFGLAGMYERAGLIGAQIGIASAPGSGTVVSISWTGEPGLDSSDQDSGDFSS
jgi:signal transduction histidine kinase